MAYFCYYIGLYLQDCLIYPFKSTVHGAQRMELRIFIVFGKFDAQFIRPKPYAQCTDHNALCTQYTYIFDNKDSTLAKKLSSTRRALPIIAAFSLSSERATLVLI